MHKRTISDTDPAPARLDWDDLRFALAVADAGSLNGGAATLGVRHSTVLRRLDALEARLGTRLFERLRQGYQPTEAGELVVAQAREMRPAIDALQRRILGRDLELTGALRLNASFVTMQYLLPRPLAAFARAHPAIEVEVSEASALVDLSRRDADLALRLSSQVPAHLVGRELGRVAFAAYALRGAAGLPQRRTPLDALVADARWIGFERGRQSRFFERWMLQHVPEARTVFRVDLFNSMVAMLHTGLGIGLLPRFAGDREPAFVAVSDDIAGLETPLWLLTHPDLRGSARIRAFLQQVGEGLQAELRGPALSAGRASARPRGGS